MQINALITVDSTRDQHCPFISRHVTVM